jgi:hypothetical protein
VRLVDITPRVIEQVLGIPLSANLRIRSPEALAQVAATREAVPGLRIVALVYSDEDVRAAAAAGVSVVEVISPSRPSLYASGPMGSGRTIDVAELLEIAFARVGVAKECGLEVRADINYAGVVDLDYRRSFCRSCTASTAASASRRSTTSAGLSRT